VELRLNTNAGLGPGGRRPRGCRNPTEAEVPRPIGAALESSYRRGSRNATGSSETSAWISIASRGAARAILAQVRSFVFLIDAVVNGRLPGSTELAEERLESLRNRSPLGNRPALGFTRLSRMLVSTMTNATD